MSSPSENLRSLPPNVFSKKVRGHLDLAICSIHWKTSKVFTDVKIKLQFWGESEGISCSGIKIVNKSNIPLKSLRYQIRTNKSLFASYLKNCEPLRLEVYSSKTGDFIGSSEIKFPAKFQSIEREEEEQSCRITSQILSTRRFSLGEVVVAIDIQHVAMTQKTSTSERTEVSGKRNKLGSKQIDLDAPKENNFNKENIQVVGNKKRISFREPKPTKPSTLIKGTPKKVVKEPSRSDSKAQGPPPTPAPSTIDKQSQPKASADSTDESSIINYLSGEPMSRADEHNFLNQLTTISPTPSVIESLNRIGNKSSAPAAQPNKLAGKFNSIRIKISLVELNSAGQLEAEAFMSKSRMQKYVLKCAVTSKCFKSNDDIKVISPVFETAPQRIQFVKEITQRIVELPCKANVFVNFGFCMKSIEQRTSPFFLGFSRVDMAEVAGSKGSLFHKKCPIINESDMRVGTLTVKIELGINEIHFGRHLIESLYSHRENVSVCSEESLRCTPIKLVHQKVQTKSHPSHSNDQCDSDRHYESKNVQTEKSSNGSRQPGGSRDGMDDRDTEMVDVEKEKPVAKTKVYSGLLFVEGLRNVKEQSAEYFITYEGLWNQCQETSSVSVDLIFNYLKQFPIICDDSFLARVQNNQMELKLWEKTEHSEKWIGSARIPLHQFYIAFRDVAMIEHLSANQLPIISIDTWSNFISPLSSELFCQGKVLLAIGSESQIEYLKLLRNLHNLRLPVLKKSAEVQVEPQTALQSPDPNSQMKSKLTAFIESLSQKLPEPSLMHNYQKTPSMASTTSSSSGQQQLRKTSELLESLQKALAPLPTSTPNVPPNAAINQSRHSVTSDSSLSSAVQEKIRMEINIDHASHLPKVVKKKQNRRRSKNSTTPQKVEFEPSAYATFETSLEHINESSLPSNVVKSHEGLVQCTKVQKGCDPHWNEVFLVQLPLDILTNPQKRFIVKIWRKVSQESDMKPAPFEDAVVGFSAIDLSVLLTGLPILSGYYNIMDFSGRCNGQIKLSLKPLENLTQYQDSSTSLPVMNSSMNPLSIDVSAIDESGPNLLSRTLKRKFTELDEITQRLKARLFDVTGDENSDPDEEFERDLNTAVDEIEDQNDFAWLKSDTNGNAFGKASSNFESQLNQILQNQPSTSKAAMGSTSTLPTQRQVSGCSNPSPMAIDELLKKYDLDTLINPLIFKNLLDPTLANSDSTPTLNPKPANTDELANVSGDSGDTTVSSILSNDQIQTIQNALQKTSLREGSDQGSSRKDPDGENNLSE